MDLAQLREATRIELGVPSNDPLASVDKLTGWVNQAVQAIATERDWPWLDATDADNTATVADQDDYTLPDDWRDTRSVTINDNPVRRVNVGRGDSYLASDDFSTRYTFSIDESAATPTMTIQPTPGDAWDLVHRYVRDEPELAGDSETPLLPRRWHWAIVNKAAAFGARTGVGETPAATFDTEFETWMRKMRSAVQRAHGNPRVEVRRGGGL